MKTHEHLTKWIRLVLAAAMALAIGLAIGPSASAVDLGPAGGFTAARTSMELEDDPLAVGNKTVQGTYGATSFDWNSILPFFGGTGRGPYVTNAAPGITAKQSLGVVDTSFGFDVAAGQGAADACDGSDPSGLPGSQTVATFPFVIAPENNVNNKGDLCSGGAGVEVLEENGQYRYVLYQYWTRQPIASGNSGEFNIYQLLEGPEPGRCDDLAIWYDYASNEQQVENISVLEWNSANCLTGGGDPWVSSSLDVNAYSGNTGFNVDVPSGPGGVVGSFGESAVDLTAAGVIPTDECATFTLAGFVSSTSNNGNPNGQQLLDVFTYPDPIVIDTCADVRIDKNAEPSDLDPAAEFDYLVQKGSPASTNPNSYTGTLTVPGDESESRSDVVSSPSYAISETGLDPIWTNTLVSCQAFDPVARLWKQYSYVPPASPAPFPIAPPITLSSATNSPVPGDGVTIPSVNPGEAAACLLVNRASAINIEKVGSGNQVDFDFTHNFGDGTSTVALNSESTATLVQAGQYTITETLPAAGGLPAWNLQSIVCFRNGDPTNTVATIVNLGARSVTATVGAGESVTCRFDNVQDAQLFVNKVGAPDDGTSFPFDTDAADGNLDGVADFNAIINGSNVQVADAGAGDTVSINELTPAGWVLNGVQCSTTAGDNSDQGSTFDVSGATADAVVTLAAGEVVLCTFTNTENGRIIVDKSVDVGNGTFQFGSGGFDWPDGDVDSITTTNGTTADGDELVANVAPGSYSVTEQAAPGFSFGSITCVDPSGGSSGSNGAATINVAAGETVRCSFANTRNKATFTLAKSWGPDTPDGVSVQLAAATTGPAPLDAPISTQATSASGVSGYVPTDRTMTIYSGQTVDFSEAFSGTQGDGYLTTLDCGGIGGLTPDTDLRGGLLVVGNNPTNVTCTFENTPKQAGVALAKSWVAARSGETALLGLSTAPTNNSDSATSTAPEVPAAANTAFVDVVAGDTVTFTETVSNNANYTTGFTCVTPGADLPKNAPVVGGNPYTYTLLIDTEDVNLGKTIVCRFVNTRIAVDLILEKDWDDAKIGDAVTLRATRADTSAITFQSAAEAADQTDTSGDFTVYAGEVFTLSESWDVGDDSAYTKTLSCSGAADTNLANGLTIAPVDMQITCTWVNARRSFDVRVEKQLVPASDNGKFNLVINGQVVVTNGGDGAISAPTEVFVGDTVTFAEDEGANTSLDNYGSTVSCDNDIVVDGGSGISGEFVMPSTLPDSPVVICTFTNTRRSAPLTVLKDWVDSPENGDSVVMDITAPAAPTRTVTDGVNSNDGLANDTNGTSIVYAGESITVAESFIDGVPANYESTLVCSDANGFLVPLTESLSETFTVPSTPTAITCTFENVRKRTDLTLRKEWISGAAGDTADLTIVGEDANSPAEATSTSVEGTSADVTNKATLTVYAGETVDLDEVVVPGANYSSELFCTSMTSGVPTNDPEGAGRSWDLLIDPADTEADDDLGILCSFRNTRLSVNVELVKDWNTSPENGDTVELNITGSQNEPIDGANSNDGDDTNDSTATVTALAGETITLSEVFDPDVPANYATTLECLDGEGKSVGADLTHTEGELTGDLDILAADAGTTIICTFTNKRLSTTLTLEKAWVAAASGDKANLSISATDSAGPVTATAPAGDGTSAQTAEITVYAGETVTLSEALDPNGTNAAVYDATAFTCEAGTVNPAWASGATSATLDVIAADVAEPFSCTFTNRARRGTIIIVKAIDGVNDDTFDFEGDWPADGVTIDPDTVTDPSDFSITTDELIGSVTFNDVITGSYEVSELDPGANFDGTSVTCVETGGDDDSGPLTPGKPLTGMIDLDDGEIVTCTFTNTEKSTIMIVKDAQPNSAQNFGFTGDLGAFTLDDDGDGTLSNTFTSGLLNAEAGSTYEVNETGVAGWTLDLEQSICSNDDEFAGSGVIVDPAPGTTVTCTFVNTANPAGLSATKAVSGQIGPWGPFQFTLSGGEFTGAATQPVNSADPTADWTELVEGQQYTLTEAQVPGYETGAEFVCSVILPGEDAEPLADANAQVDGFQFTAVAGAVYDCDITNVAIPGEVDVTKTVTGVAVDYNWSFEFTINPVPVSDPAQDASQDANGTGDSTSSPVTWTDLVPGTKYMITETSIPGWTPGDIECTVTPADPQAAPVVTTDGSFSVTPGSTVECNFDNAADLGDVSVTKTVTGVAADYEWDFDFTIDPEAAPEATQTASGTGNSTSSPVVWTDLVPGETYSITEDVPEGWTQGAIACTVTPADPEAQPIQLTSARFTVEPGDSISCDFDNAADPGDVSITKSVTGVDADYEWDFDFTIDPFEGTVAPKATQTASGIGNTTSDPLEWTGLVPGESYTIAEDVPDGWTQGPIDCTVTAADDSTTKLTAATFSVEPGDSISCEFDNAVNPADVSVTKTVDGGLDAEQAWKFGFMLTPDANPAGSQTASGTGDGSDTVSWTNLVPGEEYVLAEVLPGENTTTYENGELTCTGVDDDDDDPSTVTFVAPLGGDGVEVVCSVTNTAQSDVVYDKLVDSVTRDAGSGVWTITYLIEVENAADAGTGVYDLSDTFEFGEGVSIVPGSAAVSGSDGSDPIATLVFDGQGNDAIVIGESIAAGATHTFEVSVDVTIVVGPGTDGDCTSVDGEGTGFLNTMSIVIDGGEPEGTDACAGFAQLTLVKTLVNDDGGNGTLADFPLTAEGPATLTGVSGTADVSSAVPAGSFALAEEQLVEGYTNDGFVCVGATGSSTSSVTLEDGDNAVCTITNDDEPVDLELTKDDGGFVATAGEPEPFEYTISVTNLGPRELDDEPVTVVDNLPAAFRWVAPAPAGCIIAGQTLTCTVDPADLRPVGTTVTIEATAQVAAGATAGTYNNRAYVTTSDDPVCDGRGCTPPPCTDTEAIAENNNVDCEPTTVVSSISLEILTPVCVNDAPFIRYDIDAFGFVPSGGAKVTFYDLEGNFIETRQLPTLAGTTIYPGATVDADGNATDWPGWKFEGGLWVPDPTDNVWRDGVRAVFEVNPTTEGIVSYPAATTACADPTQVSADLEIVKSASVAQIGAGGGFNWTLDITNNGPDDATNVVIGDIVPSTLTVTGVSSSDFDCDNTGNTVECTIDSLAVGDSGTVTIAVTVPSNAAGGSVTNVGTVESSTPDPDLTNNSDDATVTIVAQAPPTIAPPPVTLPRTGSDATQDIVRIASLFLLLGGAVVLITRRRRNEDVVTD